MIKTVDDVLDANRKLLNVLSKRLSAHDADELLGQEFLYVSSLVSLDQLITTELDSAFVVCSVMFPNRPRYTNGNGLGDGNQIIIENMSAARTFSQAGDTASPTALRAGISPTYFGVPFDTDAGNASAWGFSAQYGLKEPYVVAPGSVLRATFLTTTQFTASVQGAFTRVSSPYQDTWVLLGYKIKLV